MSDDPNMSGEAGRLRERLIRGLFMLLFFAAYNVAEIVLAAVMVVQFLIVLINGTVNERLQLFGASLSVYVYQIFRLLTYNTESRPWPLSDWPPPSETPKDAGERL